MSGLGESFRYYQRMILCNIAPVKMLKRDYNKSFRRYLGKLDFNHLVYYPQKLNWIKLFLDDDLYQKCSDKYLVREYLVEKGLGHLLNDVYQVYDSIDEIDLAYLPESFVLRASHGCGWKITCVNKAKFNLNSARKKLKKWMKKNYYYLHGEPWYRDIKPRILCERYLCEHSLLDLLEYRVYCFHGKAHVIQLRIGGTQGIYFDRDWKIRELYGSKKDSILSPSQPENLDEMLRCAELLSEEFIHVCICFYLIQGELIFHEMLFTPRDLVFPRISIPFLKEMGDLMKLPMISKDVKV